VVLLPAIGAAADAPRTLGLHDAFDTEGAGHDLARAYDLTKTGAQRRTRSEGTRTPASVMMRIQRSAREGVT
jgi:hypothetical protein